jgi:MerR family Zn(II)-responsive transcriptional regulator of zntA
MDLTLKKITEITGLSADTLRYYEKEGIVFTKRQENGYRYYDESDVTVLKYIVVMKYAGFSLSEIKSIVKLFGREPSEECSGIVKNLLDTKILELKLAIRNYQKIVKLMEASRPLVYCADAFRENEQAMNEFISQIFDDIQKGEFLKP